MTDFEVKDAAIEAQSVSIGLFGPSGCGKTLSALRLAKGLQSVAGGLIYVIDTEARRALDYSDSFKFKHVDFKPPFGSDRYLEAVEACRAHGTPGMRTIIIDSLSHEHESEGGVLEQFESALAKFGGGDNNNARAWAVAKKSRKKFVVRMDQMRDVNFILTFRADDKSKPGAKGSKEYIHLGFVPIGGTNFVYGTKATCFLPPAAEGLPKWDPEFVGEKLMRKLPIYLRDILNDGKPLSEEHGRKLAEWASRGTKTNPRPAAASKDLSERVSLFESKLKSKNTEAGVMSVWSAAEALRQEVDSATLDRMSLALQGRMDELKEAR